MALVMLMATYVYGWCLMEAAKQVAADLVGYQHPPTRPQMNNRGLGCGNRYGDGYGSKYGSEDDTGDGNGDGTGNGDGYGRTYNGIPMGHANGNGYMDNERFGYGMEGNGRGHLSSFTTMVSYGTK